MREDVPDLFIKIDAVIVSDSNAVFRWTSEGYRQRTRRFPPDLQKI